MCHRCKRKGHYKNQCRSKDIAEVNRELPEAQDSDLSIDYSFLGAVSHEEKCSWTTKLLLLGQEI